MYNCFEEKNMCSAADACACATVSASSFRTAQLPVLSTVFTVLFFVFMKSAFGLVTISAFIIPALIVLLTIVELRAAAMKRAETVC